MTTEKETARSQSSITILKSGMRLKSGLRDFIAKILPGSSSSIYQVVWLLTATIIAGSFNYLANVVVGKLLGPEQYGIYAALLSFSLILSAPMSVIQTIVANYSARFAASSSSLHYLGAWLVSAWKMLLPWGLGGGLLIVLLSGFIANFLNIRSQMPVILLGLTLVPVLLFPVVMGGLQGLQRFGKYGWGQIFAALLRLGLGVGFILLGLGVSGALLGGILAGLGAFSLGWWWLRDVHSGIKRRDIQRDLLPGFRTEISNFSIYVILSMFGFLLLMNIDTIAVKSRFLPIEAGLYSAVATIGRVVLYIPTAVVTLMFPRVAGEYTRGNPTTRIALRALLVTVGLSILGVLVFSIQPELIMRLLFGQQFVGEAGLLLPYSIAMLLLAVVNVWLLYFLAVEEKRYTALLLVGVSLIIFALFALPLSLICVVWAMIICNGGLVLAGGYLFWRRKDG